MARYCKISNCEFSRRKKDPNIHMFRYYLFVFRFFQFYLMFIFSKFTFKFNFHICRIPNEHKQEWLEAMKDVSCNNSSYVCNQHFRECDYKISGKFWFLHPSAVPTKFVQEEVNSVDSKENDENVNVNVKYDDSEEQETQKIKQQTTEIDRLETEKKFWKEECMKLNEKLLKSERENEKLRLISITDMSKLKVIIVLFLH